MKNILFLFKLIFNSNDWFFLTKYVNYIKNFKKPEPYKGKGIKFVGEILRRKAGKSAGK